MNSESGTISIIGGDSFLGAKLKPAISELAKDVKIVTTTRRPDDLSSGRFYLDIANLPDTLPFSCDTAILLAGIWDYHQCANNPKAWQVNVLNMAKLAESLLKSGSRVCYVSSNTVFGGERPWCNEGEMKTPHFPYAEHKAAGENAIADVASKLELTSKLKIVRITKLLDADTSPLPSWFASLENGQKFTPFEDLIFAPLSVDYAANALARIVLAEQKGIFHLSGEENINYVNFARLLAEHGNFNNPKIAATTSRKAGIEIPYLPTYSGLGMKRTTDLLNIHPQPISSVVEFIYNDWKKKKANV